MTSPRSVERLVEDQARRWAVRRAERRGGPSEPLVTISRQPGAGGRALADNLCKRLSYDLFDRDILHQVARSAHLSERLVSTLDDRDRSSLADWLATFTQERYLSRYGYLQHLTRVVGQIAYHGRAVILGRGVHLILGPGSALRVLAVAPLAARVARVAAQRGIDEQEARRHITKLEEERAAFVRRHFHKDLGDPTSFDLVLNTQVIGIDGAAAAVAAALPSVSQSSRAA